MSVNQRCINNRLFTLVYENSYMHCGKSGHHRLIFHTAVFRHLSLEIMAAIKHFPALLWLRFPAVVRGTLCHFFAVTFPPISPSVFVFFYSPASLCCLSNLICGNFFAILRRHPPSQLATVSFVR